MENHEDLLRNNKARNTNSLRIQEDYVTQESKEIEGRVTKKLPREFSATESRILDVLSKQDEFPLNPQSRNYSEAFPETSWNSDKDNQRTNEDSPQNDPHPELSVALSQYSQKVSPDETSGSFAISQKWLWKRHDSF